ncbi:MAG: hypothetical protein GF364_07785, partial [Candidatus Lokiarchaeota archaeon]|nr:hypothetical protein [Candidatus Lokiarchaeota archaeon]
LLNKYIDTAKRELSINYKNLNKIEIDNIGLITAIRLIKIDKLFPLLVDNLIEEIYIDSFDDYVYLDHQKFNRCRTKIHLDEKEFESLKTLLRLTSTKRLDLSNPSVKCIIQNVFFNCRFTLDVYPIQRNGFSLDIRKMNKRIFTLPELIYRKMLSSEIASFLYFCVINRLNITIVGETNTGKTTLMNSLDLLAPKQFRKVYVEEAPESLSQNGYDLHQLKYHVDPNNRNLSISSKTGQIYKLLHRNPDIIYLGEILNTEEATAMFHCLSAGLVGFQTIHARGISSLLNRWKYHFKIDNSCLRDLDIILILRKKNNRMVYQILELEVENNIIRKNEIFRYNPNTLSWDLIADIDRLRCLKRLMLSSYEYKNLKKELAFYKKIFEYFVSERNWNIIDQINVFHKFYTNIYKTKSTESHVNWDQLAEKLK